jgi:predicted amidophosphoribosyltransferase
MDTTTLCDRCQQAVTRTVPAYWGERLCPDCCLLAVQSHDLCRSWPPLPDGWPLPEAADAGG